MAQWPRYSRFASRSRSAVTAVAKPRYSRFAQVAGAVNVPHRTGYD